MRLVWDRKLVWKFVLQGKASIPSKYIKYFKAIEVSDELKKQTLHGFSHVDYMLK